MKKKISLLVVVLFIGVFSLCGCSVVKELKMSQEEIIETLYTGVNESDLPQVGNVALTDDNIESYLGKKYDFVEGIASEPMMGSFAHSIVVVKFTDDANMEEIVDEVKDNAAKELYKKWVCVEAEAVSVNAYGHTLILVMTNNNLNKTIAENLDKIN